MLNIRRVFRYIQGTKDEGVTYKMTEPDDELRAFIDSDFAGDSKTRSTT